MRVESFFLLQKRLEIKKWICEWVLRINTHKRDKIPDGLIMLQDGTKIALEAETSYKTRGALNVWVTLYRYDIEKADKYDVVLVIAQDMPAYESIKRKLYDINPVFCGSSFIITEVNMLKENLCFYQDNLMALKEALRLLKERGVS